MSNEALDRLIDGIKKATETPNNNCPYHDYGKSADKALGAYCTKHKKLVEPEDCKGCKNETQIKKYMLEETFGDKFGG